MLFILKTIRERMILGRLRSVVRTGALGRYLSNLEEIMGSIVMPDIFFLFYITCISNTLY